MDLAKKFASGAWSYPYDVSLAAVISVAAQGVMGANMQHRAREINMVLGTVMSHVNPNSQTLWYILNFSCSQVTAPPGGQLLKENALLPARRSRSGINSALKLDFRYNAAWRDEITADAAMQVAEIRDLLDGIRKFIS
ncbi:hypothetical protein [Achromobacter sp.]|uniref:hypothetical protein n=1 Tax=Achromobacter sp. TaxID=134375 RepID=UPI0028A6F742|nr:hypothetical protein [Achromobacter sp.]